LTKAVNQTGTAADIDYLGQPSTPGEIDQGGQGQGSLSEQISKKKGEKTRKSEKKRAKWSIPNIDFCSQYNI
jgi:hypothetical protein